MQQIGLADRCGIGHAPNYSGNSNPTLTSRDPFRKEVEQTFMLAANRIEDMYITASSATDIYCLVRKYLHSTEQAKNVMEKLYELFAILDVTPNDCTEALGSNMSDHEDAVIFCCAVHNHMDYIVTRNIKDYEKSKVWAILPDEFIQMISHENE